MMLTMKQTITNAMREQVKGLFRESGQDWPTGLQVQVDRPTHEEHGDYATNVAMQLAKLLRKSPMQIAAALREGVLASGSVRELLEQVEVVTPGFINMRLNWQRWAEEADTFGKASDWTSPAGEAATDPGSTAAPAADLGHPVAPATDPTRAAAASTATNASAPATDPGSTAAPAAALGHPVAPATDPVRAAAASAATNASAPANAKPKVVIEHTSINPNKAAHIGHLRNSCIGDTLARLYKRAGYQVEVHNYIDDLGNQLADTVVGLLHAGAKGDHRRFGDYCWDTYAAVNKAYAADPALTEERTRVLHELEEGNTTTAWLGELVAEKIVREHTEEMRRFGIRYDLLVWESHLVRQGFWAAAFAELKQTEAFTQVDAGKLAGCWVLKQAPGTESDGEADPGSGVESTENNEHQADKVLVRSNGILTYTAKDIAYHLWKFGLLDKTFTYSRFAADNLWTTSSIRGQNKRFGNADIVLNVIDHRQEYPQAMVKQALQVLGFTEQADRLQHVSYGVVSLSPATAGELGIDIADGKSSYAMSGRQGIGIKVADMVQVMERVIEEKRSRRTGLSSQAIAVAAIRYYLLRYNLHTEVVFDLHKATEITGNTGVYLLYAHARAASIVARADKERASLPAVPAARSATVPPVRAVPSAAAAAPPAFPLQLEPAEYGLLRQMAYWPDTLAEAIEDRAPNGLGTYAFELATAFNTFYAACPILKAEGDRREFRVWLTAKCKATLADALQVLGLPTPSRM